MAVRSGRLDRSRDLSRTASLYLAPMNDEFQWWLLLVGLVIGALLVFLVMVDFSRSADEQADAEVSRESGWIARTLEPTDGTVDPDLIQEILRLNREWLAGSAHAEASPPPAEPAPAEPAPAEAPSASGSGPWQAGARSTSDVDGDGA
jgi:hypothetical protein